MLCCFGFFSGTSLGPLLDAVISINPRLAWVILFVCLSTPNIIRVSYVTSSFFTAASYQLLSLEHVLYFAVSQWPPCCQNEGVFSFWQVCSHSNVYTRYMCIHVQCVCVFCFVFFFFF